MEFQTYTGTIKYVLMTRTITAKTYLCRLADQFSWGMAAHVHQLYADYHPDTCSGLVTALDYRQT